jgi:hypothetical protein
VVKRFVFYVKCHFNLYIDVFISLHYLRIFNLTLVFMLFSRTQCVGFSSYATFSDKWFFFSFFFNRNARTARLFVYDARGRCRFLYRQISSEVHISFLPSHGKQWVTVQKPFRFSLRFPADGKCGIAAALPCPMSALRCTS